MRASSGFHSMVLFLCSARVFRSGLKSREVIMGWNYNEGKCGIVELVRFYAKSAPERGVISANHVTDTAVSTGPASNVIQGNRFAFNIMSFCSLAPSPTYLVLQNCKPP